MLVKDTQSETTKCVVEGKRERKQGGRASAKNPPDPKDVSYNAPQSVVEGCRDIKASKIKTDKSDSTSLSSSSKDIGVVAKSSENNVFHSQYSCLR